jgi:hypothetical protein
MTLEHPSTFLRSYTFPTTIGRTVAVVITLFIHVISRNIFRTFSCEHEKLFRDTKRFIIDTRNTISINISLAIQGRYLMIRFVVAPQNQSIPPVQCLSKRKTDRSALFAQFKLFLNSPSHRQCTDKYHRRRDRKEVDSIPECRHRCHNRR